MRLLIVVVNYRTADLAEACLTSLRDEVAQLHGGAQVIVTDNASGDDSVARLRAAVERGGWSAWATILPLPRNGGFAYGNNEAIRAARSWPVAPEYVLLLNPDTLVKRGALQALLDFMDAHPRVGIAGSRLEDRTGQAQASAFRFHTVWSEFERGVRLAQVTRLLSRWVVARGAPQKACRTDWVSGASCLIRWKVIEQIGLLDEGYFMYYEEVDFCERAARARWERWYVAESRIVHLEGQASGIQSRAVVKKRRPAYWFESRRRYFVKNRGLWGAAVADAAWVAGFGVWRVRRWFQRKPDTDPPHILGDFMRHSVFVKGLRM